MPILPMLQPRHPACSNKLAYTGALACDRQQAQPLRMVNGVGTCRTYTLPASKATGLPE